MTPLRITVFGTGSVGLAMAATYAGAGAPVTVLASGASVAGLREQGIAVTGVCGDYLIDAAQLTVCDADDPRPQDLTCDVLIVATKACQVRDVLQRLMQRSDAAVRPQAVLLLQNGWGSAEEARAVLPKSAAIFSSIMMIGIERRSPTHVNVNVQASPVRVGTLFAEFVSRAGVMKQAVALGQAGFLPITYEHPIEPAILNKLLFNTCLNAIGAITRMSYGELVSNPHTRHLIIHLADETIRVIRAERRFELAPDGATYVEQSLTPLVMPKAAAHRSSMLQDVEAGRRTEIDYLNGAIVRLGRQHGIATPHNDAVVSLLRAREI